MAIRISTYIILKLNAGQRGMKKCLIKFLDFQFQRQILSIIGEFSVGNFRSDSLNIPQIYTTNKVGMGRPVSLTGEGGRERIRGQGRWLDVVYLH